MYDDVGSIAKGARDFAFHKENEARNSSLGSGAYVALACRLVA